MPIDITATRRRKTSTLAISVPQIVTVSGTLRRKTSTIGVQSFTTVRPTATKQRRTSDFTMLKALEMDFAITKERRTSDLAVLVEPGVLRRKSVHGHVLVETGPWIEMLVSLGPAAYFPLADPTDAVYTYYHDYYGTKDDQFDTGEGEGQGIPGPSLIPGDPDGQSVGFGYDESWPYLEHTEIPQYSQTQLITVRYDDFTQPDGYTELFGGWNIDLTFYPVGHPDGYTSEISIGDGAYIPVPMTLDDLTDDDAHLMGIVLDATDVQLWVDGTKILDTPHGATADDSTFYSIYPFDSGDSDGVVVIDDVVAYARPLEAPEMTALWTAWQGEVTSGPSWEVSFAVEKQRRTAGIELTSRENEVTVRWRLVDTDTGEQWTMPINPDSMTSPARKARSFAYGNGWRGDQRLRVFQQPTPASEWEWSGVIRTRAHYDQLVAWASKSVAVEVTDHLARTYRVFITDFLPTDRTPRPGVPWRLRYSMKARILERLQ